jgi:hypothetical protein
MLILVWWCSLKALNALHSRTSVSKLAFRSLVVVSSQGQALPRIRDKLPVIGTLLVSVRWRTKFGVQQVLSS